MVIGVRFFAISRALSRYCERLVGHDTTLRSLADLRVKVFERLEALAPAGIPAFRRGDLLERLVGDVDALRICSCESSRRTPPLSSSAVRRPSFVWYVLPAAGVVVAVAFFAAAVVVPRFLHCSPVVAKPGNRRHAVSWTPTSWTSSRGHESWSRSVLPKPRCSGWLRQMPS